MGRFSTVNAKPVNLVKHPTLLISKSTIARMLTILKEKGYLFLSITQSLCFKLFTRNYSDGIKKTALIQFYFNLKNGKKIPLHNNSQCCHCENMHFQRAALTCSRKAQQV